MIFEKQIQLARTALIQPFGNYRDVVFAPLAVFIQLTGVAIRIIQFEIHSDLPVGFFRNSDKVMTGGSLSVYAKDALAWTLEPLGDQQERTHRTHDSATG
jgi:hypothetical protein